MSETITRLGHVLSDQHVTITDPADTFGMPLHDGLASTARATPGRMLPVGTHHGTTLDGVPVVLHVGSDDTTLLVLDRDGLTDLLAGERAYLGTILRKMRDASSVALATTLRSRADDQRNHVERLAALLRESEPCQSCRDGVLPPHDPSPRCQSGKRRHCTCSACF